MRSEPEKPCIGSPLTALDGARSAAVAERAEQVTLALAVVGFVSRRALRNVKIVDLARGDVVDEAWR